MNNSIVFSFIAILRVTGCDGFPMPKKSTEDDKFLLNTMVYDLGKGIKI